MFHAVDLICKRRARWNSLDLFEIPNKEIFRITVGLTIYFLVTLFGVCFFIGSSPYGS